MSYKSIFTVVTNGDHSEAAIRAASAVTQAEDGHLSLLALGVDRTQVGYSYVGSGAVLIQAALDRAEAEARETEATVRRILEGEESDLRWSLEIGVTQIGMLTELIAQRARFADLVVLPKPYGPGQGQVAEAVAEAALFEAQAPVLIVPETGIGPALPRRAVVAWNQSREAMVAVRRALPLLKACESVNIAVIDPPSHGPERSDPGGLLCQMLVRHGVKAEVSVLARTMPRISDILARHLRDTDSDLLVMGAYGHSRFREAILGGATRNMLEQATVPVLMAH
ncbi:MAG: universal stress protein [Paracoccaceae bacterium]